MLEEGQNAVAVLVARLGGQLLAVLYLNLVRVGSWLVSAGSRDCARLLVKVVLAVRVVTTKIPG